MLQWKWKLFWKLSLCFKRNALSVALGHLMSSPEFRLTNASNVVYSVLLPALLEMSGSGTTEVTTATSILMLTLLRALLATLELQQWEVKNTVWFGFLNLSWILHQQTLCILDPKLSIQRWGKKVSFSQWWCCMTSSSSHLPILHWKIKVFKCQHISGVLGAVPKSSTHIGWGGAWGQGYNWCCDVCVWCSRGNHPLCLCKGLSCDCPELPIPVSTGDTIITPPLLHHSHYWKGHMPDMLQAAILQGSIQFTSVLCIPSCLAGAVCRHGNQHRQGGCLQRGSSSLAL